MGHGRARWLDRWLLAARVVVALRWRMTLRRKMDARRPMMAVFGHIRKEVASFIDGHDALVYRQDDPYIEFRHLP